MKNLPLLMIMLLSACITDQKALNHLQKHNQLAPICSALYPPDIRFVPGRIITKTDTQYIPGQVIPCPPGGTDTLWMRCPPTKIIHDTTTQRDTLRIRDIAAETAQKQRIDSLMAVNRSAQDKARELAETAQKRWQGLIALGAVGFLLFVYLLKKTFWA
jgi:hypothetical protein